MADLKFVDQHNMVACLEKTEENTEFHQIVDFLSICSINYALIFWNTATSKTVNSVKQIHAIVDGKAVVISESSVRSDLLFNDEDGIACLTNDEIFENLALMGYEQLSIKLTFQKAHFKQILPSPSTYQRKQRKTQKHRRAKKVTELPQTRVPLDHGADEAVHKEGVTVWKGLSLLMSQAPRNHGGAPAQTRSERVLEKPNEPPLPKDHTSRSGEGSMEHTFELTDNVPNTTHDSPLSGGYTPGSDEGRMELIQELMETCTSLTKRVLALEEAKTAQDRVITRLKLRVKRLEKKRNVRTSQHMKIRLFKGRVESSDDKLDEEDASKQGRIDDKTKPMFQDSEFDELYDDMDNVEEEIINTATIGVSVVSAPVTTTGVAIGTTEPRTPPTTAATAFIDEDLTIAQTLVKMRSKKAKVKGIAFSDVAKTPRLNRSTTTLQPLPTIDPKNKGKCVMVEEKLKKLEKVKRRDQIESDAELAQRLHEEELKELNRAQKERQKQEEATSAALAEEFDGIDADRMAKLYEREKNQIDDFKPIDDDSQQQAESTKKRPRAGFEEESSKKQKLEEDNDAEKKELRDSMDVAPRDDVAIDVESLTTKYLIVNWKTHILNENMMYYQIIKADGSSKNYKIFNEMLDDFDRQDVIDLHRLVNKRYETTSPGGYDLLLWRDLKTLFEPNKEDEI
ncbi:hypothetical protein Tco_0459298 [Tanacetum coccineum]